MQLNYFHGYTDCEPKVTTLEEVVRLIADDASVRDLTEKHRYYLSVGDAKSAKQCKRMLPCFAAAVLLSGGKQQQHIVNFTGLTLVDIDHVAPEAMEQVLALIKDDPHTLLCYTTVSGQGIRVIVRYSMNENQMSRCGNQNENQRTAVQYDDVNANDNFGSAMIARPDGKSTLMQTSEMQASLQSQSESSQVSMTESLTSTLTSTLKETPSLYKTAFHQVNTYYQQLTGMEPDRQCKNVTRLSGIAHDPAVHYNPEAVPFTIAREEKRRVGRPRHNTKVEAVEHTIAEELRRRGVTYVAGNHNRYISQACYLMNRYGVTEEACTDWALAQFGDYLAEGNDVAAIVHSCYQQTEEHATQRPPRETQERYASVSAIEAFLTSCVELRRNVITGFPEVRYINDNVDDNDNVDGNGNNHPDGKSTSALTSSLDKKSSPKKESEWRQFTDDDRNSIWRQLSKQLKQKVIRQDISAVVKSDFSPKFNAFEEYIRTLPPWDGTTDHIDRLATSVTVKDDQDYFRTVLKKWMVAFIAAIFDPEEVNHEILVFIGRQGSYKSTWFHYLLPPELRHYFLPKLMSNSGITKDDLFKIAQSGLVCLEEIDNMKQRDLNQLKALTTMRTINERRSYGEFNEFHRHIASFCATGNNRFFLTDHTGNRRFLTFEIESIIPPQTFDYGYEGVYAQAYALWKQGFRYWFNEEENDEINRRNSEFEAPNKEKDLILKYYRAPMPGEACRFLTATDILERINSSVKEQLSTVRIGMVLRDLGIERIRSGNLRGYRLVENTQADIDLKQKSMGNFTEPHTSADTES